MSIRVLSALSLSGIVAAVFVALVSCTQPAEVIQTVVVEREVEVIREVEVEVVKEVEVPVTVVVTVETVKEIEVTVAPDQAPTPVADKVQNVQNAIAAGGSHSCGLRQNGQAVCWGDNEHGQLSPPGHSFTAITAGYNHTCGLRENGQVACWGDNEYGQSSPPGHSFTVIEAGWDHTCGLRENGEALCWGGDYWGAKTPPPGGRFIAIDGSGVNSCGLRTSGQMVCWGYDNDVPEGPFIAIVVAGDDNSYPKKCGLRENGEVECFNFSAPEGRSFTTITALDEHMCGLRRNGEAMCWGNNEQGRAAAPAGKFADISAGYAHSCGVRPSGEALCWGNNEYGETDVPRGLFAVPSAFSPSQFNPSDTSFDAASVLARFSTDDPFAGEARAAAAGEILAYYESGKSEGTRVLELLHTVASEASIEARRRAADELALLAEDDHWSEADALDAVQHLAEVITGEEINAEGRLAAANEMIDRYETGDLNADHALNLLDTIAPGMSINQRRQAAASLARLAADTDWDHSDRMTAASEVFRLVTGVPLDSEQRIDAAVDLTAVGVKIFDTEDNFDDRDIDNAAELIKQAVAGELTTESVNSILASGN